MRSEGYSSRACLSVCVSVTLNLTCRMFVRLTNDTTYLTGNEGQKFRTVFSENAPLQSCLSVCVCVCVCVCYSQSHLSNVSSSHKRYDLLNGQRRSEISNSFL